MKKVLSSILLVLLVISTVACSSSPKPDETVNQFLTAFKTNDFEKARTLVASSEDLDKEDLFNTEDEVLSNAYLQALNKIEFEIISSEVNEDTAIVETEITAPNLFQVMTEAMSEIIPIAFASAFGGESNQEETDQLIETMLIDKLSAEDIAMTKSTVKINLSKSENSWLINTDNDLINGLTGNILKLENMFN